MKTLSYLNGVSSATVSFTDSRGTNVIFDRVAPKNYSFTETELSFDLLVGANILEIINPSIANVRYKINLGTTDAILDYGPLPPYITVGKSGSIYTFYGIDTLAKWDLVKQPTIIIDPEFAGSFSYSAAIIYNTDTTADNEFEWTVGIYLPQSLFNVTTSITAQPNFTRGAFSNMQSVSTLFVDGEKILRANFNLVSNPVKTVRPSSSLVTSATVYARPKPYTFTDETISIYNPQTELRLGRTLGIVNDWVISSIKDDLYSAYVYNISDGTAVGVINKEVVANTESKLISGNSNLLIVNETQTSDNGLDYYYLYKKQTSGDPFLLVDQLTPDTAFETPIMAMSENYFLLSDPLWDYGLGDSRGKVWLYSLNETTGFNLIQSYTGAFDNPPYTTDTHLGFHTAITNSYFCFCDIYNRIYVKNTSNGSNRFTIDLGFSGDDFITSLFIDGNILYIGTSVPAAHIVEVWNISTQSKIGEIDTLFAGVEKFRNINSKFIAMDIGINTKIYNKNNFNLESTISNSGDDFIFYDVDTLLVGISDWDNTRTNQGTIQIRKEN